MMKVSWSIAHLDPLMLAKFQSIWDVGDANAETLRAAERVLQIIDETGVGSDSYRFYHWEAIRVTMTLSQMLLRHETVEGRVSVENLVKLCFQGLDLCRKMVPRILTRVEDALEQALKEYNLPFEFLGRANVNSRLDSVRHGSLPKLTDLGVDTSMDVVEDPPFPYDNPGMVFIKGALEGDHEGLFLGRMDDFAYGYAILLFVKLETNLFQIWHIWRIHRRLNVNSLKTPLLRLLPRKLVSAIIRKLPGGSPNESNTCTLFSPLTK